MAAEAVRSGNLGLNEKLFLTLTGLLMEGVYTHNSILGSIDHTQKGQQRQPPLTLPFVMERHSGEPSFSVALMRCLFRNHLMRQLAHDHFAYLIAFFSCL
jgi:hypothetical protein